MATQLKLGDIAVDVVLKDIKNVHLSVLPPNGRVRISAPRRMTLDLLRVFAISKLSWIKQQQRKLRDQERETRVSTWSARLILYGESATCSESLKTVGRSKSISITATLSFVSRQRRQKRRDATPSNPGCGSRSEL
jgi:predicted metal-dependent hydrolase